MGGPGTVTMLAMLYIISEALSLSLPIWMAIWTAAGPTGDGLYHFLNVYVALSFGVIVMMTTRDIIGTILGFRAARRMHAAMFASVLRAPMSFFQDTPHGRITNRFSKDTSEIDKDLIWACIYTLVPVLSVIGNFAMVGGIAYMSIIAFMPAFWLYYLLWKYYNKAALDLKRISKVLSSPVYDHFSNLCRENAITVVRAHHQVEQQCIASDRYIVEQQRPEYTQTYMEFWFCMRVEHLGCVLVFLVSVFAVFARSLGVSASAAALALSFAGMCSNSVQSMIGQFAEFGMAFNCVERVMHYSTALPAEAALVTERRPPCGWPSRGVLRVENLKLRYRAGLPLVLKGVSFCTAAGERLGVVGRTGAGKSSLLLALLRIIEPEPGSVLNLDGEDLALLGLKDLRSAVAMIPQEPVLFQESLQYNCDPFQQHSMPDIWAALEEAQLAPWIRERTAVDESSNDLQKLLALEIKERGQNLSAGQRQMVSIARAVLRRSKLVVLDEATAAVDAATDSAIQTAVRRCFRGATTLTIAHRLNTILDCDRILVLSEGEVAELGPPSELRLKENGIFSSLLEASERQ
ncbi:unnamed protein product [Polarella glacialis]|nr:unnamed protein product [Polarella glacialis]